MSALPGLCLTLALLTALPAAADEAPLGASLEGLLAYAREHNPELHARRLEAQAARERIESEGALRDPRAQIELMDFTNAMAPDRAASLLPGQVGTTRYRVIQELPYWGKRDLRRDVAAANAAMGTADADAAQLELESGLRSAHARYYQAAGKARILRESLALVAALERLALTRYSVGLVPQQDVLRAQSEITGMKVDLLDSERERRAVAARLNGLLPRPADAPLAEPVALPPLPAALPLAALSSRLKERSPELAKARQGLAAAEKDRDLTRLDRYPDFAVGLTANRVKDGTSTWDLMFEVNIPLQQTSRRARERESERRAESAQARIEADQARLEGRLGETLAAFEANRDMARLLRDTLLPQAEATLQSARAAYETGQINFNSLIDAERQILKTRLSLIDAETEATVRRAELEQLVGAPL